MAATGERGCCWTGPPGVHYLHTPWINTYRPIRSHDEGANGRFKSGKLDIGDPKHRPAPGQVTQALLLAVVLAVANLTVLETWLAERVGPDELTSVDFDASGTTRRSRSDACPAYGTPATAVRPLTEPTRNKPTLPPQR